MNFIYTFFLKVYYSALWISSFFHPKSKKWIQGRKNVLTEVQTLSLDNCIWFHVSSLGEFEQVSYLIEQIKSKYPSEKIIVTFFSPSGFEVKKNFQFADYVTYLPFDFKEDIVKFINAIQPKMVFWVRYEFWLNTLSYLKKRKIPVILLNGVFRNKINPFYQVILKKCLACFDQIYVISENSKTNLNTLGFPAEILYDTRYDRMKSTMMMPFEDEIIQHFTNHSHVIICGSIWENDDKIIENTINLNSDKKWILVPHEVHESRISSLLSRFPRSIRYSRYDKSTDFNILILDKIGFLSKLYRYADVCYIGGGFDKVVHSLVEPLAYSKPIIIGKNIEKSEEAIEFIEKKLVIQISNSEEFKKEIDNTFSSDQTKENINKTLFFQSKLGSIDKILSIISK